MQAETILKFWFEDTSSEQHFTANLDFDKLIHQRFANYWRAASQAELAHWRHTIQGRLAEIIILDQFSRQLFRGQAQAFAYDSMALALAQEAISSNQTKLLSRHQTAVLYLPFMHSESSIIHQQALKLYEELNYADFLHYEIAHKQIIDRFGRYPHRNNILGRQSSVAERLFLQEPNSSF